MNEHNGVSTSRANWNEFFELSKAQSTYDEWLIAVPWPRYARSLDIIVIVVSGTNVNDEICSLDEMKC